MSHDPRWPIRGGVIWLRCQVVWGCPGGLRIYIFLFVMLYITFGRGLHDAMRIIVYIRVYDLRPHSEFDGPVDYER